MIATLLLVVAANAAPPTLPIRSSPTPTECRQAASFRAGMLAPSVLDSTGTVTCSGVLLPTSEVAYLLEVQTYSTALRAWYDAENAALGVDLAEARKATVKAQRTARVMAVVAGVVGITATAAVISAY